MKEYFDYVYAPTDEVKDAATSILETRTTNAGFKDHKELIVESSERENQLMELAQKTADIIIGVYCTQPPKEIPRSSMVVFKEGGINTATEGKLGGGIARPGYGIMAVEREKQDIHFLIKSIHELLHLKSTKIARTIKDEGGKRKIDLHRSGLSMYDVEKENVWFGSIEEAIVEELTNEAFQKFIAVDSEFTEGILETRKLQSHILELGEEILPNEGFKKLRAHINDMNFIPDAQKILIAAKKYNTGVDTQDSHKKEFYFLLGNLDALSEDESIINMSRRRERVKFYGLCKRIFDQSPGEYESINEVFVNFVQANFTGNILDLARKIEKHLGEGSFRKIGEEFAQKY